MAQRQRERGPLPDVQGPAAKRRARQRSEQTLCRPRSVRLADQAGRASPRRTCASCGWSSWLSTGLHGLLKSLLDFPEHSSRPWRRGSPRDRSAYHAAHTTAAPRRDSALSVTLRRGERKFADVWAVAPRGGPLGHCRPPGARSNVHGEHPGRLCLPWMETKEPEEPTRGTQKPAPDPLPLPLPPWGVIRGYFWRFRGFGFVTGSPGDFYRWRDVRW